MFDCCCLGGLLHRTAHFGVLTAGPRWKPIDSGVVSLVGVTGIHSSPLLSSLALPSPQSPLTHRPPPSPIGPPPADALPAVGDGRSEARLA